MAEHVARMGDMSTFKVLAKIYLQEDLGINRWGCIIGKFILEKYIDAYAGK